MLDIPESLIEVEKSIVSKDGYDVCKGLRSGDNVLPLIQGYGWKDKKDKDKGQQDSDFWIFKGRRKEDGPFA